MEPTLARLIIETRSMLNQPDATNASVTDAELTNWLNDGINRFFVKVADLAEGQFTTTALLNVASGQEAIDLPSDFYKIKAMWSVLNDGSLRIIPYINNLTMSVDNNSSLGQASNCFSYSFRNNQIVLSPIPQFTQTGQFKLEYIQFPDNLIWGGDVLTAGVSPLFKELVIMYAVYKAKVRESLVSGTDVGKFAKELLMGLQIEFEDAIRNRSKYPQFTQPYNPY